MAIIKVGAATETELPSPLRARLLDRVAGRFEAWRQRHARLGRELRDQPFLLAPPSVP